MRPSASGHLSPHEGTKCYQRGTNTAAYGFIVLLNAISLSLTIRTTINKNNYTIGGTRKSPYYSQIIKVRPYPLWRRSSYTQWMRCCDVVQL